MTNDAVQTWRVVLDDGEVREVAVMHEGDEYFTARGPWWRGFVAATTARAAVVRVASHGDVHPSLGWPAAEILAPGQASRADIERDLAAERAMRRSYEEGITWETSCLGCAKSLTNLRATEERAEKAEAELHAMRPAAELHWIQSGHGATSTCARCGEARTAWCVGCGYCETTCCVCDAPFAAEAPHG